MINIAQTVEDILQHDDVALAAARNGWLNLSAYARAIQPQVAATLMKPVQHGSVITALARVAAQTPQPADSPSELIQRLAVHANLEGITYERTQHTSALIRETYNRLQPTAKSFLTVTQGITEITIVAEAEQAQAFRTSLKNATKIYDKQDLVGITVTFSLHNLEQPNLIYSLTRRLAYKDINVVEVVSTATELTFVLERANLAISLEQLQKGI